MATPALGNTPSLGNTAAAHAERLRHQRPLRRKYEFLLARQLKAVLGTPVPEAAAIRPAVRTWCAVLYADPTTPLRERFAPAAVEDRVADVLDCWDDVRDPEDALARANNSEYGLGGSIWSPDADAAYDLATRMDSGTVWVNKHAELAPNIPFGGAKGSGIGVELGEEGLAEFTQLQVINIGR